MRRAAENGDWGSCGAEFRGFRFVMSPADARTKGLLASGVRACARARMEILNWSRRKETLLRKGVSILLASARPDACIPVRE